MQQTHPIEKTKKRRLVQAITWILVPITIVGGLKYHYIGFLVLLVMLVGLIGGFFRGRYVCGWLCPRGAFFDRILSAFSPRKKIPSWLRSYKFRWIVFALLMGFMVLQVSQNPLSASHWGAVLVRMCIVTTTIGVVLALVFHPRTWCSFCPMGTIQSSIGGKKMPLYMKDGCKECGICEQSCPIGLKIVGNIKDGKLNSRDCLKCPECQSACPINILYFKDQISIDG